MGNFFGKVTGVFCFHYLSSFFFRKIKMTSTDFPVEAIDRLCFVCGSIIMKNRHHILPVLKEAMSLTFERSINLLENVTPSNICHSCWRTVKQFSDQKKRGLCFNTSKTILVWLPHSHTDCSTCDLYLQNKKGKKKKKKISKFVGRPKNVKMWDVNLIPYSKQ